MKELVATNIFISVMLSSSCIKKIDYTLKDIPPQLVLSSMLMPDSLLKVYVSSTKSILDTGRLMINNADVKLYQNNVFFADLKPKGNGLYMCNFNFTPFEGRTYKVVANAPSYKEVSAETLVPVLRKNYSLKATFPYHYDQNNEPTAYMELTINDPPNENNYYELCLFYKNFFGFNYQHYLFVATSDEVLNSEGDINYSPSTLLLSDKLFDGTTVNIQFELREYGPDYYSLRFVSEPYYKYKKYLLRHLYNQNSTLSLDDPLHLLFSGEPINMYKNVIGDYGAVVGYSGEIEKVKL